MNTALKNLKRKLYRQAHTFKAGSNYIEDKGVLCFVTLFHYFTNPSDELAVQYVVEELQHEIEKLEQKEISKDKWPKFLQDEHWKEKTYEKFGVPYPREVNNG
jgi:hypothetical protein